MMKIPATIFKKSLISILLIAPAFAQIAEAAAPVGDTIWLKSKTANFVTIDENNGYRLRAIMPAVGSNTELFSVEDAGGNSSEVLSDQNSGGPLLILKKFNTMGG